MILTRRIHTLYSHTIFTRHIHTPYTHANPFIRWIREEFEQIEWIREETERRTHTPYTDADQQSQLPVHRAELLPI